MIVIRDGHARRHRAVLRRGTRQSPGPASSSSPTRRLAGARAIVAPVRAARVRVPCARLDPALARVRVLQPASSRTGTTSACPRTSCCDTSDMPGRSRRSGPRFSRARSLIAVWRGRSRLAHRRSCPPHHAVPPVSQSPGSQSGALMLAPRCCLAADLAVPLPGGARLARVHLSSRSDQRAPRRGVAARDFAAGRYDRVEESGAERVAVRHPVGVLELLGARQVALHGSHHGEREDLRDAAARLLRISRVRARVLHDVRLRAPCWCACSGLDADPAARSRCNLSCRALNEAGMSESLEREIKLRFDDRAAARAAVLAAGASPLTRAGSSRTPARHRGRALRRRRSALRVRIEAGRSFADVQRSGASRRHEAARRARDDRSATVTLLVACSRSSVSGLVSL